LTYSRGIAVVVSLAVAALTFQMAGAHATLVSSNPPADSVIPETPDEIRVTFDKELDSELSSIELVNATGSTIADGGVDLDDPDRASMTIDLPDDIPPGEYTVHWTVVESEEPEEHEVEGEYIFSIDPTATPTSSPTVAIVDPVGTIEPVDDVANSDEDNDGGIGRGALIVGGVSILVAIAVVASIGRRRYMR
jgi:methionine-rich copper-binding protein CopC